MGKKAIITLLVLVALIIIMFTRIWPHASLEGTRNINTLEFMGGCWMGDVRVCDYDPFE
jgi:branched-subunit amino acid transport protein AzlD